MVRTTLPIEALALLMGDADACAALFAHWRWSTRGFTCPHCESRRATRVRRRPAWCCLDCRRQTRLTAGTAIHGSHVTLGKWVYAIFCVAQRKGSISALRMAADLSVAYATAWSMLQRVRRFLAEIPTARLRRGLVEVAAFSVHELEARPYPRTEDACPTSDTDRVILGVERMPDEKGKELDHLRFGRVRAMAVPSSVPIAAFLSVHVPTPTGVERMPKPIEHVLFQNLTDSLRSTFHGVSCKHLPAYVREHIFRFNRRRRPDLLPHLVGKRLARGAPLSRASLRTTAAEVDLPVRSPATTVDDDLPAQAARAAPAAVVAPAIIDRDHALIVAIDRLRKEQPRADARDLVKLAMKLIDEGADGSNDD